LLEWKRFKQQESQLHITGPKPRHSSITLQTLKFNVFAEANVIEKLAIDTIVALLLEKESSDTITNLELILCLRPDLNHGTHRLMGRHHWEGRLIGAFPYLVVDMAAPYCSDLDQDVVVANLWHRNLAGF
jgi:hypothetical protein